MEFNIRQKKVIEAKENKIICLAGGGAGKALPNSTKIPTPDGWKTVKEIKVGDYLFDRLGRPTKVLGVYPQGEKEVYEITFGDKRKARCCEEHIWYVNKSTWKDHYDFRERTLKQIFQDNWEQTDKRGYKKHLYSIPCSMPVQYSTKNLKIHPYVIGAFLGDGCCLEKMLTFSSSDFEIVERISQLIDSEEPRKYSMKNYSWVFPKKEKTKSKTGNCDVINFQTEDILGDFKKDICCKSFNKRIPKEYKYGDIEQRLELIRGLMDTDGSITYDEGRYHMTFTTASPALRDDFIEVMGSLGYVCTYRVDKRTHKYTNGETYEIKINISNSEKHKLFFLPRKRELGLKAKDKKQHRRYDKTAIINIQKLNYKEEMTCFYVDNEEHLFLMNDFIVTHNTSVLTERIKRLLSDKKTKPEHIVAITFTNLAAEEMKKRLGDMAKGMFIGTIHSYANAICIANGIPTDKYLADADFDKILKKVVTISQSKYPKIKHLLIDEFQDTGDLEYSFIEKIPTENFFVIADDRQAIYGFKGATDKYLRLCCKDVNFTIYHLNQNYRCAPNILKFADSLIASMDKLGIASVPVKTKNGIVDRDCSFIDALEELEWSEDYGNWAILCRTNNELATAIEKLEAKKIPYLSFKKGDLDLVDMENILREDKVKVLTIHTAKGLEFKRVIVTGARIFNEEERRIAYVAATRAEQCLYWCPSICGRGKKNRPKNRDDADAGNVFKKFAPKNIMF